MSLIVRWYRRTLTCALVVSSVMIFAWPLWAISCSLAVMFPSLGLQELSVLSQSDSPDGLRIFPTDSSHNTGDAHLTIVVSLVFIAVLSAVLWFRSAFVAGIVGPLMLLVGLPVVSEIVGVLDSIRNAELPDELISDSLIPIAFHGSFAISSISLMLWTICSPHVEAE